MNSLSRLNHQAKVIEFPAAAPIAAHQARAHDDDPVWFDGGTVAAFPHDDLVLIAEADEWMPTPEAERLARATLGACAVARNTPPSANSESVLPQPNRVDESGVAWFDGAAAFAGDMFVRVRIADWDLTPVADAESWANGVLSACAVARSGRAS